MASSLMRPLLVESKHEGSGVMPAAQKLLQLAYSEDVDRQLEVGAPCTVLYLAVSCLQHCDTPSCRRTALNWDVQPVHAVNLIV